MTAPEPLLRGASSPLDNSILLVKTSLESLRSVCVKLREASANVRVSVEMKPLSSKFVAAVVVVAAAAAAVAAAALPLPSIESSEAKPLSLETFEMFVVFVAMGNARAMLGSFWRKIAVGAAFELVVELLLLLLATIPAPATPF